MRYLSSAVAGNIEADTHDRFARRSQALDRWEFESMGPGTFGNSNGPCHCRNSLEWRPSHVGPNSKSRYYARRGSLAASQSPCNSSCNNGSLLMMRVTPHQSTRIPVFLAAEWGSVTRSHYDFRLGFAGGGCPVPWSFLPRLACCFRRASRASQPRIDLLQAQLTTGASDAVRRRIFSWAKPTNGT